MQSERIKKMSVPYFITAVFFPIVLIVVGGWIGYHFFRDGGTGAVVCFVGPTILSVLWWFVGPSTIWKQKKKKMMKDLDGLDFTKNHTFYGNMQTVVVDLSKGQVALLFFWNPSKLYVRSASCIDHAWTEDGAGGVGFLRGTSRVSFLFQIDGIKVRVNTFTSNQRWKMEDPRVLEGISKADVMVQALDAARQRAGV